MPDNNQTNMTITTNAPVDNVGAVSGGANVDMNNGGMGASAADASAGSMSAGGVSAPANDTGTAGGVGTPMPINNPAVAGIDGLGSAASDVSSNVVVTPEVAQANSAEAMAKIIEKMGEAHNVLIALSSDPSVDEMCAAIGLSMFLDRIEKKATAIYSGSTPNALEFLEPEKTFESNADILRDFVIALNKEKADHLRYKLDGDYVKIFITPYKALISDEDLEFSYGDYNVELVIALNVANGIDLDSALREHGRIMHDATVVNITTGNPGKFGEIEWSNKAASSVSEMIANLIYSLGGNIEMSPEEATAFLTGIVAATDRFSKPNTTALTMQTASKLMTSGANQQLITKNITEGMENQFFMVSSKKEVQPAAPDTLKIEHEDDRSGILAGANNDNGPTGTEASNGGGTDAGGLNAGATGTDITDGDGAGVTGVQAGGVSTTMQGDTSVDMTGGSNDMTGSAGSAMEEGTDSGESAGITSHGGVTIQPTSDAPADAPSDGTVSDNAGGGVTIQPTMGTSESSSSETAPNGDNLLDELKATEASLAHAGEVTLPEQKDEPVQLDDSGNGVEEALQKKPVIAPSEEFLNEPEDNATKYGKMLEEALAEAEPEQPVVQDMNMAAPGIPDMNTGSGLSGGNPAAVNAPEVASKPEINGVPEMNFDAMKGDVLPPPPTPPVDLNMPLPSGGAAANRSGAGNGLPTQNMETFKIPGM